MSSFHSGAAMRLCTVRVRQINGRFYAYFRDVSRRPIEKSYPLSGIRRRTQADQMARKLADDYRIGRFDPWTGRSANDAMPQLLELKDLYLAAHPELRPKSVEAYEVTAKGMDMVLPPGLTIGYIEPQHLAPYIEDRGVSDATRQTRYRHLRALFNWAVSEGILPVSPMEKMRMPKAGRREAAYLNKSQLDALLKHLNGDASQRWLLHAVIVAVTTGLRRGEVCNLRWEDFDADEGRLHVRNREGFTTKSGHERLVPLPPSVVEMLKALHAERSAKGPLSGSDSILLGQRGKPLNADVLSHKFKGAAKAAKLPGSIHFHSLRHTNASYLVMGGVQLLAVAKVLGHSSTQVTERYAHLSDESVRSAHARAFESLEVVGVGKTAPSVNVRQTDETEGSETSNAEK